MDKQRLDDELATIDIATNEMAPYFCCEYPRAYLPDAECIPQFVGTSLALTIPLFMLHRQRISFNNLKTPPPPRRSNTTSSSLTLLRGTTTSGFPSTSKQDIGATSEPSDISSSPGMGEVISAVSQMNQSTAFRAAKAFLVATGLVAVGGVAFTWAVKTTLGVENAREFGQKMRSIFHTTVPGLRSRLYRPPETDDERYQIQAYEEGGIAAWAQVALRELEAEVEVERAKRDREQEAASAPGKMEPSSN